MTKKIQPPGQERAYPDPTKTGTIPFEYAKNGMKGETAYWIWGDLSSGKTPLICLHGGPGVPHQYLLPISLMQKDHGIPVVMYDQIGCGGSTRFKDKKGDHEFWSPQLFMEELDNVKRYLGIEEFDLLGQSWGGMLAGQYAIEKQPAGLRKLIISNSPSNMKVWVDVGNRLRKQLPKEIQDTLDRCEREGKVETPEYEEAVMYFYSLHVCRVDPFPKELEKSFEQLGEDNTVYYSMCGPSEFFIIGNLKNWSITGKLDQITETTVPGGILIMNGYYDEAQDETTEAFFTKPSARVKWVRYALSSHMPMLEETEKYLTDLGRFLTQE
ncbi:uncharacterized protein MYCFIDRAFT_211389 [Pseudocercospora fijiensis CIRAD86]|uniref:AB hydrolase-1 domain-containing protein n=1 Tax=Pseudocercospora fijiensis (strain CIRAD86) TaxID=383855 RepID=M3B2U3_PSEFD|nr:uncharacterized protein MYCFIDRAFT_211389 [Pseudocercospora fijiensis CIRAD86]EME83683.1 hypothetical protein MYCFIDRAFT_211389 [Pseudocercospora fijiensis CIRAD86]